MERTPHHVVNKATNALEKWKEMIAKCPKLAELTDLEAKVMATI
jgi:hypothetical protein